MAEYEQMEFDVRLESDRDLQENVNLAIDFACKQVQHERPKTIENRHEAYGIIAEQYARRNPLQHRNSQHKRLHAGV